MGDQGTSLPISSSTAPQFPAEQEALFREVLQLLKRERWPIRAYIEYEYHGTGTPVEEVKKCYEFAKQALA